MKKLALLLVIFQLTNAFGQTDNEVEKAINKFKSGEIEEAIGLMDKITNSNPSLNNWNTLVDMYHNRYEQAKERETNVGFLFGQSLGIKYVSSVTCYDELVSKCREAELYSESTKASQLLRNYFIDTNPDSMVNEAAKKEFNLAEDFFNHRDYKNSKVHYIKALSLQPDYYKATIYLGDSYWYLNNIDSAIYYFRKGIEKNPKLLEPKKYLVDALAYAKKNEEAKNESIEAIWIYPDKSMFLKYSDLVKREGKTFNKHWIKRECEVNNIKEANTLKIQMPNRKVNRGKVTNNHETKSKNIVTVTV
jgi:tetratricopeptide (TPR) repeat protein